MAKKTTKSRKPVYKATPEAVQNVKVIGKGGEIIYDGDRMGITREVRTLAVNYRSRWTAKAFYSAEDLRNAVIEYFEWADKNKMSRPELIRSGVLAGVVKDISVDRPFTIEEMCTFIGISTSNWRKYLKDKNYIEFHEVAEWAEEMIRNRKVQGAYIGIYNPNVAIRDLGMADKSESEQKSVVAHVFTGITLQEK